MTPVQYFLRWPEASLARPCLLVKNIWYWGAALAMDARTDLKLRDGSLVSCRARTAGRAWRAVRITGLLFLQPTGPMFRLVT
eukprot:2362808-Rhodomonas_salina.1